MCSSIALSSSTHKILDYGQQKKVNKNQILLPRFLIETKTLLLVVYGQRKSHSKAKSLAHTRKHWSYSRRGISTISSPWHKDLIDQHSDPEWVSHGGRQETHPYTCTVHNSALTHTSAHTLAKRSLLLYSNINIHACRLFSCLAVEPAGFRGREG